MRQSIRAWLAVRRKAIAGLIVPLAALLAAHGVLDIDPELAAAIAALITAGAVYAVPNTTPKEG